VKILAVEAAANVCSVALIEDERLLGELTVNNKKTHSQVLMPMLELLLSQASVDMDAVDAFAVSAGPGSFTGLRIGVASIKGLAYAANKPVYGVSTLEAMAYKLPYCSRVIVPIMDARRGQVNCAAYAWENDLLKTVLAPDAMAIEQLCEHLKTEGKACVFLGDGVPVHNAYISECMGALADFAPVGAALQSASAVAASALAKARADIPADTYATLQPVYLRKSQAEREYDEKEKQGEK